MNNENEVTSLRKPLNLGLDYCHALMKIMTHSPQRPFPQLADKSIIRTTSILQKLDSPQTSLQLEKSSSFGSAHLAL